MKPGGDGVAVLDFPHVVYGACKGVDGSTVVVFSDQNKVTAYGPDKKELWSLTSIPYPRFVQALPDGNYAILHRRGMMEGSSSGKVVSEKDGIYNQLYRF